MKIPRLAFIATLAFLIIHIIETILSQFFIEGNWSFITLGLNLIVVLVPIFFLFGLKQAYEALKIIAIITVVYGFLFIYLNYTEEKAFGKLSDFMLIFNVFEILIGIFLYFSLLRKETKDFIHSK